jgi:excisionase family DNA binding protein
MEETGKEKPTAVCSLCNYRMVPLTRIHAKPTASVRGAAPASQWLTATEAADYLQVKPRTLLQRVNAGQVKAYPLSGTRRHVWRFLREDLDAMLVGPSAALRMKGAR